MNYFPNLEFESKSVGKEESKLFFRDGPSFKLGSEKETRLKIKSPRPREMSKIK